MRHILGHDPECGPMSQGEDCRERDNWSSDDKMYKSYELLQIVQNVTIVQFVTNFTNFTKCLKF